MVVYQFVFRCDSQYVGRISQRLQKRINQHITRCIKSDIRPTKNLPNREYKITSTLNVFCDSAIGQHLLKHEECAKHLTMHNFPFWLQQDFRSIYQFWKQPTSMLYRLFFVVKKNSFIHSKLTLVFFLCSLPTKTEQYFSTNQIVKITNFDQSNTIRNFLYFPYFCADFVLF